MISTQIKEFTFQNCLMNASGALCMTEKELSALLDSNSGSLVTKSCTMNYREGNESPRYFETELGSINSMGLPNLGIEFYMKYSIENQSEKPIFLSIAGLSLEENILMLEKIQDSSFIGLVELNLSCPNIAGKPQTGYDFERTNEVLEKVFSFYKKPLGVKLPPYFDEIHFNEMASILNKFPLYFVTCINSVGNGLYIDFETESVVIKPKNGFGGIGGKYVKPVALANVRKFYTLLNKDISIIGCGGIENGQDAFEHILCGASMLQIGTQLMKEGVSVFDRIHTELQDIMIHKNYNSIADFKGKLMNL